MEFMFIYCNLFIFHNIDFFPGNVHDKIKMNATGVLQIFSNILTSSLAPKGYVEEQAENVESGDQEFFEAEVLPGFRVWQLAGIIISILITITVGLCCCIRFRIPRTKQEIEADWIRKKITKNFRTELSKISDKEMDKMDLKKGEIFINTHNNVISCNPKIVRH